MTRKKIFIIAEAGINHNGDLETAKRMIDAAACSGVDAVKFQTFTADKVISRFAPKAEYQKRTTGTGESQLDMARKLELSVAQQRELLEHCRMRKVAFLSTPFDLDSVDVLNGFGLKTIKIPSGELTNLPYLRKIGSLGKKVIMSTGVSRMGEIKKAISVLTRAGTRRREITVLHCNTEYPTPFSDANLLAIPAMRGELNVDVGYSDHTPGIEASIAAAALGASIIEKHFTLDKTMSGPDHRASIDPAELKAMVASIRNIEKAIGSGIKRPSPSELKNKDIVRKSIVASRDILKGELLTEENMTVKRPGTGISPMRWDYVVGRRAGKSFKEDEAITL
jgi:N,N'-diacetyllegionaminate synthase